MLSLHARVLMAGAAVLVGFCSLAGLTLQKAFESRAEVALQERMLGQVYVLIAAFEQDDAGQVKVPDVWRESKFSILSQRILASIKTNQGQAIWQSYSMARVPIPAITFARRNMSTLQYVENIDQERFAVLSVAVAMNNHVNTPLLIFSIAENMAISGEEYRAFRRNLWISLALVALLLLILQSQSIRWVLSPLKIAEQELSAIETGAQEKLIHHYPSELTGLTENINGLLEQQREHLHRYRDSLSDLAHSLKTPLAIIQTEIDVKDGHQIDGPDRGSLLSTSQQSISKQQILQQQIDRITQITEYQLNRAAMAGTSKLHAPEPLTKICNDIINSLQKVYKDKAMTVDLSVHESTVFHGDPGDLMEMLGNLLDNAFKWGRTKVSMTAKQLPVEVATANLDTAEKHTAQATIKFPMLVEIIIEDDGPGISEEQQTRIFNRGIRVDDSIAGHGIGLAIVNDIVSSYHGSISASNGRLGGARIILHLP